MIDNNNEALNREKARIEFRIKLAELVTEASEEAVLTPDTVMGELEVMKLKVLTWEGQV